MQCNGMELSERVSDNMKRDRDGERVGGNKSGNLKPSLLSSEPELKTAVNLLTPKIITTCRT